MNIYNYSGKTGEFLSPGEARESPLEPGVFLMPANATELEPPKTGENEIAVFDAKEGAWSISADFRNVQLWDTKNAALTGIDSLGITPSDVALTSVKPPETAAKWDGEKWGADIDSLRAAKLATLQTSYQDALASDVEYFNTTFQADPGSQETLCKVLAAATAAGGVPDSFYWVDAENNHVAMNMKQLQGLAIAMMVKGWNAFDKLQTLKTAARAAQDEAGLDAITW